MISSFLSVFGKFYDQEIANILREIDLFFCVAIGARIVILRFSSFSSALRMGISQVNLHENRDKNFDDSTFPRI